MRSDINPAGVAEVRPASSLAEMATAINAAHESATDAISSTLKHARKAGELLATAKKQVGHGHWLEWLKKNVRFSASTAQRYIRIFTRWGELREANAASVPHLSYTEAMQLLAGSSEEVDRETAELCEADAGDQPASTNLDAITSELKDQFVSDIIGSADERAKLERVRRIGELLLSARKLVGEEAWDRWFDDHVDFTRALGRAYVGIFLHGFQGVSVDDAIKLFHDDSPMYEEPMAPVLHPRPLVPEPLEILRQTGLLDEEALTLLLMIQDDIGPEVVHFFNPEIAEPPPVDAEGAAWLFNGIRPLDQPTLWPHLQFAVLPDTEISASSAVRTVVLEAVRQFVTELFSTRRGQVHRWEGVAFWYGSMAALVHSLLPNPSKHTVVGIIRNHVARWRESLYTALDMFLTHDMLECGEIENGSLSVAEWWGYHSDLRHAGILDAAKAIKEGHAARYPTIAAGQKRFRNDLCERGTFVLPSSHQGRVGKADCRPIDDDSVESDEKS